MLDAKVMELIFKGPPFDPTILALRLLRVVTSIVKLSPGSNIAKITRYYQRTPPNKVYQVRGPS